MISTLIFFFFKQKTAYEMRIRDWSSDVCSSDLDRERRCASGRTPPEPCFAPEQRIHLLAPVRIGMFRKHALPGRFADAPCAFGRQTPEMLADIPSEIGRASCRERLCQ